MKFSIIILLFSTITLIADSCPHCGRTYGSGSSSDSAYIQSIRSSHEATCSSRQRPATVYADDLNNNNSYLNYLQLQINMKLQEVNSMVAQLSGSSQKLFKSLDPEKRSSLQKAMNSILEEYLKFNKENTYLNTKVTQLSESLDQLEKRLQSSQSACHLLIRKIGESSKKLETLENQKTELLTEVKQAEMAVQALQEKLHTQKISTDKFRKAYWNNFAEFIKDHKLNLPRVYMKGISVRSSYAARGTVVIDNRVKTEYLATVNAQPVHSVRVVHAVQLNPQVKINKPTQLSPVEFEKILESTNREMSKCHKMRSWVSALVFDTDRAAKQLEESIKLEMQRKKEDSFLKTKISDTADKVSLYMWDLSVRTKSAKKLLSEISAEWKEEKKWDLLNSTLSFFMKNKSASQSAYATVSLAKDLLNGDLTKLPEAIVNDQSHEAKNLLLKMENRTDELGKSFYENLFNYEGKPLPGQKWIEKLIQEGGK